MSIIQIQKQSYLSFADKQKRNWSVKFPTEEICNLFVMHLSIVKFLYGGANATLTQDIIEGTGRVCHYIYF